MSAKARLADHFADVGELCADEGVLDEAIAELDARVGLAGRLRALATGQLNDCDQPPDLNGLCLRCGRKIAPAVADHKRGCFFAPVTVTASAVHRLTVRASRYGRSVLADIRGRG